jgi:two-component SAPR family response regulator
LKSLVEEFDTVLGGFGDNVVDVLDSKSPEDWGAALAADLGAVRDDDTVLYIDELDRLPLDKKFYQFIAAMVEALPEHVKLAVNSRLLTYQPWYDMVERGDAVVLGNEYRRNDVMFTVEQTPRPQLEVYALGRGYAMVNGQEISNWDGALPRNLFFYFMDHPLVTRDEIFSVFWPKLTIKEATNVFHVTKRKITERITLKVGEEDSYELTQYSTGFYLPSDKVVRHYDVANFQEAIERAMMTTDGHEEELLLRRAIDAYKAPFLQTVQMNWADERRVQLQELYAQALVGMGRVYKRKNEYDRALGLFVRAAKEMPTREDIHREAMSTYVQLGMLDDARRQYQHLEKILQETVGIGPSKETRRLYEEINE